MSRIEKRQDPFIWQLTDARMDHARLTGQPLAERAYWYFDTVTGVEYRDLYGCVGWPTEVSDKDMGMAGYLGIVAVVKDDKIKPEDSKFKMLAEFESYDIPSLLEQMVEMRQEFGFGLHPGLLQGWFGDPERFIMSLALLNEKLTVNDPGKAILIIPPDNCSDADRYDQYVRQLSSVIVKGRKRLYFGGCDLLRSKIQQDFKRGNPAVFAVGGLVHSLLSRCTWMDQARETIFNVEDENA